MPIRSSPDQITSLRTHIIFAFFFIRSIYIVFARCKFFLFLLSPHIRWIIRKYIHSANQTKKSSDCIVTNTFLYASANVWLSLKPILLCSFVVIVAVVHRMYRPYSKLSASCQWINNAILSVTLFCMLIYCLFFSDSLKTCFRKSTF